MSGERRHVGQAARIPVLRPLLPEAERVLPYLRRIDTARTYTNWGPLAAELERRIADHFRLPGGTVISAASGTVALVGAILATAGRALPERPLAVVPAYTFVATAIAVELCGYRPYVVDVNADTWQLDINQLYDHPVRDRLGLVVGVSAFGRSLTQGAFLKFRDATQIPVVIDAGAGFEIAGTDPDLHLGDIPVAMSFHATKSFATGEGGCVVTTDRHLAEHVTRALNFGFFTGRESRAASVNGKMSEYHAAVGLAELDGWPRKRLALRALADRYREKLDALGLAHRVVAAPTVAGCYALFCCVDADEAAGVQQSLTRSDIEFRLWYGGGLLSHPHFRELQHGPLGITERIAPLIVGLPVAPDFEDATIERIVAAVGTGSRRVC